MPAVAIVKPETLLMKAIYAPAIAELERDFTVHKLWTAPYRYFDDLESMARESDCLVVTCPLTPATRNLVDARVLRAFFAGRPLTHQVPAY